MSNSLTILPILTGIGSFILSILYAPSRRYLSQALRVTSLILAIDVLAKELGIQAYQDSLFGNATKSFTQPALSFLIGGSLALLILEYLKPNPSSRAFWKAALQTKYSDQTSCKAIINAVAPPCALKNKLEKYEARAKPNERLRVAFGIDNCFVLEDEKKCKAFRNKVEDLIHVREDKWQEFATTARAIVQKECENHNTSMNLFSLIQLVTMKMTRKVMWDIDPESDENDDAIRRLAHEVNQQWLRSKGEFKTGNRPAWRFENQHELQSALNEAFPNWSENPLNLILPGYETMWRVVLRCFVEVTSRSHEAALQWKQALIDFLNNPVRGQLDENSYGFSAAIVSKEALRLYPPTRRIYRMFKDDAGEETLLAADVEKMHQDKDIWGESAKIFDPPRWLKMPATFKEDDMFMPFGASPFRCPAKQHKNVDMPFGVSMIALLVAVLVEATDGGWKCDGGFPGKDVPLDTDREAYKDAVLRRIVQEEED